MHYSGIFFDQQKNYRCDNILCHMSRLNLGLLEQLSKKTKNRNFDIELEDVVELKEDFTSMCYQFFDSDNSFLQHLNFTRDEIIILHHGIEGVMNQTGKRGRSPKMCTLDSVIIFLYWLKHGHEFKLIAKIFGFTTNLIQKSIDRMRSPFYQYLSQKWWNHKKRPIAMEGNYLYLALAIDSTSLKVFRPHEIKSNAKKMYDSKNKMNPIKKEVKVMTTPPYYALFFEKGFLGSEHDFSAFKHIDSRWGVVLDSGYLASKRGCVERFFGRLKKLFSIFSQIYRWDHSYFNIDFDICVYTHLELKLITRNKREQDEKLLKSKKESTNYSNRKKIRLNDSGCSSSTSCTSYSIT
ncbi:hypothetical protein A3Q56_01285 [Intoshia linei]|uniref:DDE Tnp4 domain-containing protein n=1 Tax=Intoshia linei TaxID=1819745 RepID=A0A177BBM4_9BILA|nr:hypothetical protein A3Q56_01285 [Intoshia linei]